MSAPVRILGISAYYHDSAAALIVDGKVVAAAHEERFTRVKQDSSFPRRAAAYCLAEAGVRVDELDAVAFYEKPSLKFSRLLTIHGAYAPHGLSGFIAAMRAWFGGKLFMRANLRKELARLHGGILAKHPPLFFPEHHLSHAASAYYPSPFQKVAMLTIDGVGEWATTTIGLGEGKNMSILRELRFPHSLGLLYAAFTYYCGFKVNSGEYKLMGLAPYGAKGSERVERFKKIILEKLIDLKEDGSLLLAMDYFAFGPGGPMTEDAKWQELFGVPRRDKDAPLEPVHEDLALAIQEVTNEIVVRLGRTAQKLTGAEYLVMAGGVALNCVANAHLLASGVFKDVWVQPAAGDAGGALGAALAAHHISLGHEREVVSGDAMQGAYLGPEFTDADAEEMTRAAGGVCERVEDERLFDTVATLLDQGNIIGWFQGRMEWGPRALGNRSIIADPRNPEMQKKLNLKIKFREGFRPFAPSVLEEDASEYFESDRPSPYMLFTASVVESRRKPLAPQSASIKERLNALRSDIPSITHLDYSARLQTVSSVTNPRYWKIIDAFKRQTGYGLIVNTSFNVRGEPIVMAPDEAYRCFIDTDMDYLVIGNLLFDKKAQPKNEAREKPRAFAED